MDLADRLLEGDVRALARAISMVEDRAEALPELLSAVRGRAGQAHVVGLTGPPGSGKSTLADGIVERWRALDRAVGVLAIDPSSPFSGEPAASGAVTRSFRWAPSRESPEGARVSSELRSCWTIRPD